MTPTTHPVIFAGAGPGDPELITVKAKNALERADLVIYAGSLVPEAVLQWTGSRCRRIDSAGMHLDAIMAAMVTAHGRGERIVRLHTGDPSLYGAIFEQMLRLDRAGIPYRVIPGVSAAFAAAAAMAVEYTIPEQSQTLILTRAGGRTPVPEAESLASLAAHRTAMAIYLSVGQIETVARVLEAAYGAEAPAAVAYRVSHPDEIIRITRVGRLVETVRAAGIDRQALIVVGKGLGMKGAGDGPASRLYDRTFSHGFRTAEPLKKP